MILHGAIFYITVRQFMQYKEYRTAHNVFDFKWWCKQSLL